MFLRKLYSNARSLDVLKDPIAVIGNFEQPATSPMIEGKF